MELFNYYDVVVEVVMFCLSWVMLIFIRISQPELTKQMRRIYGGFGLATVAIATHIVMLDTTVHSGQFDKPLFTFLYVMFGFFYIYILNLIFLYVTTLSYKQNLNKKHSYCLCAVFSAFYASLIFYPLFTNKLIKNDGDAVILTGWNLMYIYAGLACCLIVFVGNIINRKTVSKVLFAGIILVAPMEVILLTTQFFFPSLVISSCSYVLPFLLFYVLFHANNYDEINGYQDAKSLPTVINKDIKSGNDYVLVVAKFPRLVSREFDDIKELLDYSISKYCRKVENISLNLRLYSINVSTYIAYCKVKNDEQANSIFSMIEDVISKPVAYRGDTFQSSYKMLLMGNNDYIHDGQKMLSCIGYLLGRMGDDESCEVLKANDEDYLSFIRQDKIQLALMDIVRESNLDDQRVIVLAQPIYNIKSDSFRHAEALMRLKLDDQIIFPDQFIPIAEKNNSIHILTFIIINKVCKIIKEMSTKCDFDGISVNCSTTDFEIEGFAHRVLDILKANDVNPKYLRLEITESLGARNYEKIVKSMNYLAEAGVRFYLDDFGTGYANVYRIAMLPLTTVKFDKSVLYRAIEDKAMEELALILIKYFQNHRFSVLVEGVEDEAQRDFAIAHGFEYIQGYFYSKPVPINELQNFFEKL